MTFEEEAATMINRESVVSLLLANREFLSKEQTYQSEIEKYQSEVKKLQEQLAWFKRQMFGKKSERRVPEVSREQSSLFKVEPSAAVKEDTTEIRAYTRKKRSGLSLNEEEAAEGTFPAHLRREDIPLDTKPEGYSDEELEIISEKITERLAENPGEQYVKRYIRKVYKVKKSGEIEPSPAPEHIFGRCKVDESVLVLISIRKFLWHLPLYRQHQMYKLEGLSFSRESFAGWIIKLSQLFSPIAEAIKANVLEQSYLHVDNTPGEVGRGNKKKGKIFDKGYFWPLLHPEVGVYFEFSRTKAYTAFEIIIDGYKGILVCDAEEIFEKYANANKLLWQLCWMHIRRNFVEAEKSCPYLAAEALEYIRALYGVEREIKEKRIIDPEKVSKVRLEKSKPILDKFKEWLRKTAATPEAITDRLLSQAIHYVNSRWDAAVLFLNDGSLPIDNGADEREVRPLKLGLKNYLFCASEVGAEAAAIFYTLIHSAKMHGIHPYYYLLDLCKRIDQPGLKAIDLIPLNWKKLFFNDAVPEHLHNVLQPPPAPDSSP